MLRKIQFTCRLFQEGDVVVSLCPEFNVSSFGDTAEESVTSLYEAMDLFFRECQRMGTLDTVLEEAGYRPVESRRRQPLVRKWLPPRSLRTSRLEVSVA
jgi:predicted RNase H-like HicB family nuclease